ncbi:MAG TPA: hypothetical protein VMU19_04615 [Bryobacteraceae bacterium]|nr:hypothetical protein [Bryobacteraceae bacterium]
MSQTLHSLGGILLRAIPTFLLVFLLCIYLKNVFFKPLEKILKQRYDATGGAKKAAADTMERASAKAGEYDRAIRAATVEIYQAQERTFKELEDKRAADTAAARERAASLIRDAKIQLAAEAEAAKTRLSTDVESLAGEIADSILRRSAA